MNVHRAVVSTTVRRRLLGRQYTALAASWSTMIAANDEAKRSVPRTIVSQKPIFAALQHHEEPAVVKARLLSTVAAAPNQQLQIQLYQYAICPFCNRVKALLDYVGVEYGTTEVNPLTKAEIKPWKEKYSKVPIATVTGPTKGEHTPMFGSDVIVDDLLKEPVIQSKLEERWKGSQMTLETFQNGPNVKKWTSFAVDDLASLLYPNMCRTWSDSYRAFDYVHHKTNAFGPLQRVMIQSLGSLAMYFAASKVKSTYVLVVMVHLFVSWSFNLIFFFQPDRKAQHYG